MAETTPDHEGVTTIRLLRSLRSNTCPACGQAKRPYYTLCYVCYTSLPKDQQRALYSSVHKGYRQAVESALAALNVSQPHWPENPTV